MKEEMYALIEKMIAEMATQGDDYKALTLRWLLAYKAAHLHPTEQNVAHTDRLQDLAMAALREHFKNDLDVYIDAVCTLTRRHLPPTFDETTRALEASGYLHHKYAAVPTLLFVDAWEKIARRV